MGKNQLNTQYTFTCIYNHTHITSNQENVNDVKNEKKRRDDREETSTKNTPQPIVIEGK